MVVRENAHFNDDHNVCDVRHTVHIVHCMAHIYHKLCRAPYTITRFSFGLIHCYLEE